MSLLQWKEEYNTGIQKMDEQHKKWMSIINQFYDQLQKREMHDNLGELLYKAIDYTNFHFSEEEKMMETYHFSGLEQQKKEHAEIRSKLSEMEKRYKEGRLDISLPVTSEMKSWFNRHISKLDNEYGKEIGPKL